MFIGYIGSDGDGGYSGYGDDGFFATSDLVCVDAQGRLRYRGRADARVKVGDHLVNPMVVEQLLLTAPGVLNARCIPEEHPILGRVLVAEVVSSSEGVADVDALRSLCAGALEPALVPRDFRIVSELRTTAAGKRART